MLSIWALRALTGANPVTPQLSIFCFPEFWVYLIEPIFNPLAYRLNNNMLSIWAL